MSGAAPAALANFAAPATTDVARAAKFVEREGRRSWPFLAGAFVASRLVVLLAAAAVAVVRHHRLGLTFKVLGLWDGSWYVALAHHGYPHAVPPGVGAPAQTTLAFFPVYPMLARLVGAVLPVSPLTAALLVSWAAGGAACGAVWLVAREVLGRRGADRVAVAFAVFPGAFVLSMAYAEGVMITGSALCLWALLRRRWVLAGLLGALAGAARPNALPIVACCMLAGAGAWWFGRERRALAATVLAPIGTGGFFAFLWWHTGSPLTWFHAEHAGWKQDTDFGHTTLQRVADFLRSPLHDAEALMVVASLAAAVVLGRALWKSRPPAPLLVYTAGVLFLCFAAASLGGRPRYLLAAFPLLFPVARLPRRAFTAWVVVSALLMGLLMWYAGAQLTVAP